MRGALRVLGMPARLLLVGLVRAYRVAVSPMVGCRCRYYPSCSAYAEEALRRHGALKGSLLAVWRVLRCNPFSWGGVDKVPEAGAWRGEAVDAHEYDGISHGGG